MTSAVQNRTIARLDFIRNQILGVMIIGGSYTLNHGWPLRTVLIVVVSSALASWAPAIYAAIHPNEFAKES